MINSNRDALNERYPGLLERLDALPASRRLGVRTGAGAHRIITVGPTAVDLCADAEPERQALAEVVAFDADEGANLLCIGFGQGYHLAPLLDQVGPRGKLAVMVLDLEAFKLCLELDDRSQIIRAANCHLIFGAVDQIREELNHHLKQAARVFYHGPSLRTASPELVGLSDTINRIRLERIQHGFYRRIVQENYRRNLSWIVSSAGVDRLAGKYPHRPAIVVAAGPSLDQNADELRSIKGRALLLVVDTAARKLCSLGISPDVVIISDPKRASLEHFTDLDTQLPLAFLPSASWQVLDHHRGKKWLAYPHADPLAREMQRILPRGQVWVAGTVSYFALELARLLAADPVIFVGLDLALTDGRSHYSTARSAPAGPDRLVVDSIDGGKVETTGSLDRFRRAIELHIETEANVRFIDATEGGARIRGTEVLALKQALQPYLSSPVLSNPFAGPPTVRAPSVPAAVTELWMRFCGPRAGETQ